MKTRIRRSREEIIGAAIPIEQWPEPLLEGMSHSNQERYWRNRRAVEMYAANNTGEAIWKATKIKLKVASELFVTGGTVNEQLDAANGFFICVPGWRRPSAYTRHKPPLAKREGHKVGLAGALGYLFRTNPSVLDGMLNLIHHRLHPDGYKANDLTPSLIHATFIELCKKAGLTLLDYPFTTAHRGRAAIREWTKREFARNPIALAAGRFGEDAKRDTARAHAAANSWTKYPRTQAYERVQLDGHLHDSLWEILVVIQGHTFRYEKTLRPMLVNLMEQDSKASLAQVLTFMGQYSKRHVLQVLRKALQPWAPLDLSPYKGYDFGYHEGAGYPSMYPEFAWRLFLELAYDWLSAQAVLATNEIFRRVLGVHSVAMEGPHEPGTRGEIEGGFAHLARAARQLPNATGGHPKDVARRDPETKAQVLQMEQSLAQIYFDVLLANLNAKPVRLVGLSPLQQLQACYQSENFYDNQIPQEKRETVLWQLLPMYKRKLNRAKKGRSGPFYVEFYSGARYSSPAIARNETLLRYEGKEVWLYVENDSTFAHLVVPEENGAGRYMGRLRLQNKRWNYPHPIEERMLADRLGREAVAEYEVRHKSTTLAINALLYDRAKHLKKGAAIAAEISMARAGLPAHILPFTEEELDLSDELDPEHGYEPEEEVVSVAEVVTEPVKLPPGDWPGFGGRIL